MTILAGLALMASLVNLGGLVVLAVAVRDVHRMASDAMAACVAIADGRIEINGGGRRDG